MHHPPFLGRALCLCPQGCSTLRGDVVRIQRTKSSRIGKYSETFVRGLSTILEPLKGNIYIEWNSRQRRLQNPIRASVATQPYPAIPMSSTNETILLLGGTGKVSSRITPLLSSAGYTTLIASRSGTSPSLPNVTGVKFDWDDASTYSKPFTTPISAIFLIGPPSLDMFTPMKRFIDLAREKSVKRFVLLSASVMEVGDGPAMAEVSKYMSEIGVEWAVLRPTWFMGISPRPILKNT
jgi:hypothetical protein